MPNFRESLSLPVIQRTPPMSSQNVIPAGRLLLRSILASSSIPQSLLQHSVSSSHIVPSLAVRGLSSLSGLSLHHPTTPEQPLQSVWLPRAISVTPDRANSGRLAVSLYFERGYASTGLDASSSSSKKPVSSAPNASTCDEAITDYKELSTRLADLKTPSTIRSWGQVAQDVAMATWNGSKAVLRFTISVPRRYKDFRAMPPEVWAQKKTDMWKAVKHEAHHYWVRAQLCCIFPVLSCTVR